MTKREALIRLVAGIEASDTERVLRPTYTVAQAVKLYNLIVTETPNTPVGAYVHD